MFWILRPCVLDLRPCVCVDRCGQSTVGMTYYGNEESPKYSN